MLFLSLRHSLSSSLSRAPPAAVVRLWPIPAKPQSSTLIIKNKNNSNKLILIATKINNKDSNNHRTTKHKNKTTSTNSSDATDTVDTLNNVNSSPDEWTLSTINKTKIIHSCSSEQSSLRTPLNKNKNKKTILFHKSVWSVIERWSSTRTSIEYSYRFYPKTKSFKFH